jgi:hypothetical protein
MLKAAVPLLLLRESLGSQLVIAQYQLRQDRVHPQSLYLMGISDLLDSYFVCPGIFPARGASTPNTHISMILESCQNNSRCYWVWILMMKYQDSEWFR